MERMAATGRLGEILPVWQAQGKISAVHYELGQVQSMEDRVMLVEWHRQWGRGVIGGVRPVTPSALPAVASRRKLRVGFMSSKRVKTVRSVRAVSSRLSGCLSCRSQATA